MRFEITVVWALLLLSTVAETATINNSDTVEVSIAFCHVMLSRDQRKDTHMKQFLERIGRTWPLGESRTRVAAAETIPNNLYGITRILNLSDGTSRTNLESAAGRVQKNYPVNNLDSCNNNMRQFFEPARSDISANHRHGVPIVWVHVIVIRSDHIRSNWERERLIPEANVHVLGGTVPASVLVVYETSGNDYYGGVAWKELGNVSKQHVGNYSAERLTAVLLHVVQHLLSQCPLEESQSCTETGNGQCRCVWTYERKPTHSDFNHYCWNRTRRTQNDLCGTTSPPAKKSTSSRSTDESGVETTISTVEPGVETTTSPESTESPPDETTETAEATTVGTIATTTATSSMSPLVIVCIVAIVVVALIAVAVAVRQCVVYRRAVKAQQKKLEECGMACSTKKRRLSLDASTTSVSGASMTSAFPAVIGSRVT